MHTEEDYNTQYGVTPADPAEGEGLCNLLKTHEVDTSGPALEIGCGTGYLTFGVGQHYPGPDFLITDPSPAFLCLTQNQFDGRSTGTTRRHYAVFNADDLSLLPAEMFSVISLRSTLHHILHVDDFIAGCARALKPGGALLMGAEPVESGYLLMASVAKFIPTALRAAGVDMKPEWTRQLNDFTDTVKFSCIRDIDKRTAEDKHMFHPHDIAEVGAAHGLQMKFLPTATFRDYAPPFARSFKGFTDFFFIYIQYCMRFDAEFLELIRAHLKDQLSYIDDCYRSHPGPAMTGVFLLKKTQRNQSRDFS
ncbi:class I SAM-dependent methyltransferase [Oleiharenicola lentus]|uniref:class I SAM-dependent methyltransferase n=1 Tax=Oleiharenicola lentus TaxID=2508720 RepID=UPI003F6760D9